MNRLFRPDMCSRMRLPGVAIAVLLALPLLSGPSPASASDDRPPFANWDINAFVSSRFEYFRATGDRTQSVYPFFNSHAYSEFEIGARSALSPYEFIGTQFSGVLNGSDYRLSRDKGLVVERFNATWEKGDGLIPFHFEAGDQFLQASPRTLSRSLRAASLEVQPFPGASVSQSLLLFAGQPSQLYRRFEPEADLYAGASYLFGLSESTSVIANLIYNYRAADGNVRQRNQVVGSLAGEKRLEIAGHHLTAEAEVGQFAADYAPGAGTAGNRTDLGLFASLDGYDSSSPLTYGVLFERYGQDYRPNGGVVASARQSVEARAGWRFDNGLLLRGRGQHYIDALDSGNETHTWTTGLNLSGPVAQTLVAGASGSVDMFYSRSGNQFRSVDSDSFSSRADISLPVLDTANLRVGLNGQVFTDRNGVDTRSGGLSLGLDQPFSLAGWQGVVAPELFVRDRSGLSSQTDTGAGLNLTLARNGHSLDFSASLASQDAGFSGGVDTWTSSLAGRYLLHRGQHTLGLESEYHSRDTSPGADTASWKVGLFYTLALHKPVQHEARGRFVLPEDGSLPDGETGPQTGILQADGLDIAALRPGLQAADVTARLVADGLSSPSRVGDNLVYEIVAFPRLANRQRLVVSTRAGRLRRAIVIVDLDDTGSRDSVARILDRVRDQLSRTLGQPEIAYEEGTFSRDPFADINSGRVVRAYEWRGEGDTIRLGIPRRADRKVRIEIHHASSLPSPDDQFWSVNVVR